MVKCESDVGTEAVVRQFEVSPAFEIELPSDRIFCTMKECADRFFRGNAKPYGDKIGCYVFSLRTGRGSKPYYVGSTVSSFKGEVFQYHKILDHYQQVVKRHKGTPTMTFVSLVKNGRGRPPESVIGELEQYLIWKAYKRNKDLSNKKDLPKTRWAIKGVVGQQDGRGAPPKPAAEFKRLFGF